MKLRRGPCLCLISAAVETKVDCVREELGSSSIYTLTFSETRTHQSITGYSAISLGYHVIVNLDKVGARLTAGTRVVVNGPNCDLVACGTYYERMSVCKPRLPG